MSEVVLWVRSERRADSSTPSTIDDVAGVSRVETVTTPGAVVAHIAEVDPAVVVCEHDLDGSVSGLEVLERVRESYPDLPFVLATDDPNGRVASEATRLDVSEYVTRAGDDLTLPERVGSYVDAATTPLADGSGAGTLRQETEVRADTPFHSGEATDSGGTHGTEFDGRECSPAETRVRFDLALDAVGADVFEVCLETNAIVWHSDVVETFGDELDAEPRTVSDALDLVYPADRDDLRAAVEQAAAGEAPPEQRFRASVDGELRWLELNGEVEFQEGTPSRLVCMIHDVTDEEGTTRRLAESQRALQDLYDLTSSKDLSFETKLTRLLDAGRQRLGLDVGFLTRVADGRLEVVEAVGDDELRSHESPLEEAYCRETVDSAEPVEYPDLEAAGWEGDVAQEKHGLGCYLGGRVTVHDDLYGTLCFADVEAKDGSFTDAETTFVELMVEWLSYELERRQRETDLTSLLEATRTLMHAPTTEAVAEEVVDAAKEVLGFELNLVRLYDADRGVLEPAAMTEETADLLGDRPTYEPGEGIPGRVFEAGEPRRYDDRDDLAVGPLPDGEVLCLPLGEQGTLTLSSHTIEEIDGHDRRIAEILATNARAALERADREEELARYGTVMETVEHMVYVLDEAGQCTMATQPLADRLGRDREAVIGIDARDILDDRSTDRFDAAVEALRSDGGSASREIEVRIQTADGCFPASVDLSTLPGDRFDGVVGVVRDRTELNATQERLADERDRFSYLFGNIPDAVVEAEVEDGEPIVTATNPAFEDLFGWDDETVADESLNEFVLPDEAAESGVELDRRVEKGRQNQLEVRRQTADGVRNFLFRGIPYDAEGDCTRAFGIYTDITEQKDRQRQLKVLNRLLRHNLRNDLTVVRGYAEYLEARIDDPTLLDRVDTLVETVDGLVDASEHVRDIEQTIGGGSACGTVDAGTLLHDVAAEKRREYPEATIHADFPDAVPVDADEQLGTALDHLVENAIEHNDGDAPQVHLDVSTDENPGQVTISVRDDGPGIPETERVVTGDGDIDQLNHASGLGLWLVRWIVESYGGTLAFEDAPAGGSVVSLTLPGASD